MDIKIGRNNDPHRRLLRERDRKPRFGLVWERDEIDHDKSVNGDFVALDFQEDLSCGDAPYRNLLIEGDNFDALRYLRMTHAGKVKCIYIDPPYNTGNRDFIYNDSFLEKDDLYRHSKWVEYMYRRLVLARDLLTDDGIIFASINGIEMAHLKLLMDQVFGEDNCLADFVWQTDGNFDNQAKIKTCHEYILAYAAREKNVPAPQTIDPNIGEDSKLFKPEIRNSIVKNGPKNPVSEIVLPKGFPAEFETGTIKKRTDKWPHFRQDALVEDWKLKNEVAVSSGWANKNLCESFIENGCKPILDAKEQETIFVLTKNGAIENVKKRSDKQSYVISVIRNVGTVEKSGSELIKQGIKFPYPKPLGLIEYLLSMVVGKDFTVLDFFGGSGTTAHAVMRLNKEDGGKRNWIVVSSTEATADQPTKNVCRDITQRRLSNAVNGYSYVAGAIDESVAGLGGGFSYFCTRRIPVETIFTKIQHDQVWYALQLIHSETISAYQKGEFFQMQETEDSTLVIYLSKMTDTVLGEIKNKIKRGKEVVIYSWQPALLKERLGMTGATYEPIPQFLVDRFGAGAKK